MSSTNAGIGTLLLICLEAISTKWINFNVRSHESRTDESFLKMPMILLRSLLTSPMGSSIMHTIAIPSVDGGRS